MTENVKEALPLYFKKAGGLKLKENKKIEEEQEIAERKEAPAKARSLKKQEILAQLCADHL